MKRRKLLGEERRKYVLYVLKQATEPLTGAHLAKKVNVSRQVIVQDIALLKAKNEPIVATPQGYVYMSESPVQVKKRVIACQHEPEETEKELTILVDYGVNVLDVIVEHAFYGELKGSLMLKSRFDVQKFLQKIEQTNARLLSELTGGVHLHTIEGQSETQLDEACRALEEEGILLRSE